MSKIFGAGIEGSVKNRQQPAAWMGIIDRGTKYESVTCLRFFNQLIGNIVENTLPGFPALSTCQAIRQRLIADEYDLCIKALFF